MVEEDDGPRLNVDGLSKAVLRDSKVLSRIIAETVDEAKGLSLEEIRAGLPLEEDGRTVRDPPARALHGIRADRVRHPR